MSTLVKADVLNLSVPERIQLVEDIWDTIAEVPEEVALTDEQKAELDRRLDAYHQNPGEGSPWCMVRERIRSRRRADGSPFAPKLKRSLRTRSTGMKNALPASALSSCSA
jgi:putative addiction module component (TIGR02574 family)